MTNAHATECTTCGSTSDPTIREREDEQPRCDACWADALAYGHMHGLHVDDDNEPVMVDGCPSCAGRTPPHYRV